MGKWFPTFRRLAGVQAPLPSLWPVRTTPGQRRSLLRLLSAAVEQNLPLVPLIDAWSADESGVQRSRLFRLARLLDKGVSLPDAIEEVKGVLSDEQILAIRFGSQSGTLAASIHDFLDDPPPNRFPWAKNSLMYFLIYVVVATLLTTFFAIKILPAFQMIASEFDLQPTPYLSFSWRLNDFFANYWFIWALAIVAICWLSFFRWPGRRLRYTLLGTFFRPLSQLRTASTLRQLSVASQAGRPIAGAISTLARYHFDPTFRHKLLFVRNEMEQGTSAWESMASTGLLDENEAHVLELSEKVGNRPWALKELARAKRQRTIRRIATWSKFAMPVVILLMGVFVLLQAAGLFEFLVHIDKSLL